MTGMRARWMAAALAAMLAASVSAHDHAEAGRADAVEQGKLLFRGPAAHWPQALVLFGGAAAAGDGRAAYYLGLMHKNGMGTVRDDAAARRWLAVAAAQQLPDAMFVLANMLLGGESGSEVEAKVEENALAARRWLERAADLGHAEAALQIALGLREGSIGFTRDPEQAEIYLKEAGHALRHRPARP